MKHPWLNFHEMGWQSDFSGEDCGFDDVEVIGIYTYRNFMLMIDMETMEIKDVAHVGEDEE